MLKKMMMVGGVASMFVTMLAVYTVSANEGHGEHGMMLGSGGGYGYGRDDVAAASQVLRHMVESMRAAGLSSDQIAKLKAIQLDLRRARFRGEAEIEIEELELQSLLENETSDLGAIETKLTLIEDMEKSLRMKAIKAQREAQRMLTPEQREKVAAAHEQLMRQAPGISGTWQGALSSRMMDAEANIMWTVYQAGPDVQGNFVCSSGTLKCHTVGGAISGTLIGDAFTGRLVHTDGHLCGLAGTFTGLTLHGEYSCNDKQGEDRGTWRMSWEVPGPPRGQ